MIKWHKATKNPDSKDKPKESFKRKWRLQKKLKIDRFHEVSICADFIIKTTDDEIHNEILDELHKRKLATMTWSTQDKDSDFININIMHDYQQGLGEDLDKYLVNIYIEDVLEVLDIFNDKYNVESEFIKATYGDANYPGFE